jgi:hypothetical protein
MLSDNFPFFNSLGRNVNLSPKFSTLYLYLWEVSKYLISAKPSSKYSPLRI